MSYSLLYHVELAIVLKHLIALFQHLTEGCRNVGHLCFSGKKIHRILKKQPTTVQVEDEEGEGKEELEEVMKNDTVLLWMVLDDEEIKNWVEKYDDLYKS